MIRRFFGKKSSPHPEDSFEYINAKAIECFQQGRFSEAETLWRRSLENFRTLHGEDHPEYAKKMGVLGEILTARGNYIGAERIFQKCYELLEKTLGEDHKDTGLCLQNLGGVLFSNGNYAAAESYFRKALMILEKQLEPKDLCVADVRNNLAGTLQMLGNYVRAKELYEENLKIYKTQLGQENSEFAEALSNMATLSATLGNYEEATTLFRCSLQIFEKNYGFSHPTVADNLFELGSVLFSQEFNDEASTLIEKSLEILHDYFGEGHPNVIRKHSRAASILYKLGDKKEAARLYSKNLSVQKKKFGPESLDVASTMHNLAFVLLALGNYDESENLIHRSLSLLLEHLGPEHHQVAQCLMSLSKIYEQTARIPSGIFSAKRAINIFQSIRHAVDNIDINTLDNYDSSIETYYEHLANILIKEERFGEAEHVMSMLKEKEFHELTRGNLDLGTMLIPFNKPESHLVETYDKTSLEIYDIAAKKRSLGEIRIEDRTAEQNEWLADAEKKLFNKKNELTKLLQGITKQLPSSYSSNCDQNIYNTIDLSDTFPHSIAVFTATSENVFNTIVTTPDGYKSFSSEQKAIDLSKKILNFRASLSDFDSNDYLSLAQELYDIIVRPLENELLMNRAEIVIWKLDSALRLLPLSALHDGKQFLLEKLSNVSITTVSNIREVKHKHWDGLGMGTSKGNRKHEDLGAVQDELNGIIDQGGSGGILPGKILLDKTFTKEAMYRELTQDYKAVHLASHFDLNPADEALSYFLLGDGNKISIDELRQSQRLFEGVELISFSACSTGLGSTNIMGREVDGIGYLGELQGAKSILATLWPVEDISTSKLMREFYRLRESGVPKVKALRKAQLALLEGEISSEEGLDFTHPYFWAPFILIGNAY